MFLFRFFNATARERQLQTDVDDLKSQLAAKDRIIAVKEVEIAELAAVVVRNQERLNTETALAIRRRAEHEGATHGRTDSSQG